MEAKWQNLHNCSATDNYLLRASLRVLFVVTQLMYINSMYSYEYVGVEDAYPIPLIFEENLQRESI